MAFFTPPELPDKKYYIFGRDGGKRVAKELGVDFLGEVPIDPRMADYGDQGEPVVVAAPDSDSAVAFKAITDRVVRKLSVIAMQSTELADANLTWVTP